jgi:hypothetical protein
MATLIATAGMDNPGSEFCLVVGWNSAKSFGVPSPNSREDSWESQAAQFHPTLEPLAGQSSN